ncbi:Ribonuclease H2 subunit C [Paramuricea clavata]|uniref:Ribonuclease H2 subunit C n=1 Tax=Paramuricea clavata TaxID=317549 RepID=A0A7D9J591_PARCT|nr:Ribonuclease H2 subunit C [Paramuricea clavata]
MRSNNSTIKLSSSSMKSASEVSNVHFLPCKIQHNGEAKVDEYFQCSIKGEPDGKQQVSFRGRILQGETMNVPEGYYGYVLTEDRKPVTDEEDRSFKVSNKFSKFTYWNLEDTPSLNDKIKKAMQWVNISSAIHGRVEVDTDSENNTPDTIR